MRPTEIGIFQILIIILSIYVLLALAVDTFLELPVETSRLLGFIDDIICIIFLTDFFISLYKAGLLLIRGYVVGEAVWLSGVAATLAILGVHLGAIASRRVPAIGFKRLVTVALVASTSLMMTTRGAWRSSRDVKERPLIKVISCMARSQN